MVHDLNLAASPSKVNWPSVIRNYRMSKRLKQAALAADLGVTQAMISRWENGESDPPDRVKRRMTDLVHDAFVVAPAPTWADLVTLNPAIEFVTDSMGMFKAVSRGALEMFGVPEQKANGYHLHTILGGDFVDTLSTLRENGMFHNDLAYAQTLGRMEINVATGLRTVLVDFIHWPRISMARATYCVHSGIELTEAQYMKTLEERGGKIVMRRTL